MRSAFNSLVVTMLHAILQVFRLPGLRSPRIYALWGLKSVQPLIERLGSRRAYDVYRQARETCPAYRRFLTRHGTPRIRSRREFAILPQTTKDNYIKAYSIEDRCRGGRIPSSGVVIDESSGSSGTPNNWVRGAQERASVARLIRYAYQLRYRDRQVVFLNCFALGPWATGMNVSMAIADTSILKSIGPDAAKLESTLRLFGNRYEYVIAGYPPFVKDWLDHTALDLRPYRLHLICGGEGYSIGLRTRFEKVFRTVTSSYGASDLEINIAAETDLSAALRRCCHEDRSLCRALFGRDDAPMIFQYHPLDYLIEQSQEGELIVTVLRRGTVAPKIRYNIRDLGGALTWRQVKAQLAEHGADLEALAPMQMAMPFLYVYGRNDLSVPFYGAKVFSTDLDRILNETPELGAAYLSFNLAVREQEDLGKTLVINLERRRDQPGASNGHDLKKLMYDRLRDVNQDFREVSRLFGPEQIEVNAFDHGTGPFGSHDIRLKRSYISACSSASSS